MYVTAGRGGVAKNTGRGEEREERKIVKGTETSVVSVPF
jgi:hypothetical protein